jgi:hypothetical protein
MAGQGSAGLCCAKPRHPSAAGVRCSGPGKLACAFGRSVRTCSARHVSKSDEPFATVAGCIEVVAVGGGR